MSTTLDNKTLRRCLTIETYLVEKDLGSPRCQSMYAEVVPSGLGAASTSNLGAQIQGVEASRSLRTSNDSHRQSSLSSASSAQLFRDSI